MSLFIIISSVAISPKEMTSILGFSVFLLNEINTLCIRRSTLVCRKHQFLTVFSNHNTHSLSPTQSPPSNLYDKKLVAKCIPQKTIDFRVYVVALLSLRNLVVVSYQCIYRSSYCKHKLLPFKFCPNRV